ncbi:SH3 domain protein [Ceratobasidium sp. AG-Ba]|nr:SH3 domain protein [Ceratobasidium sp. AG-Ba]QRW02364.1 SH3 domain protein [Ceratobasidium sp. AG-Ba]
MGEVQYVWAQHDFNPEHDDEIAFRAGDRIEIVEKDELYGDGWWQGRDPSGKVGLFPEAYTTREPPQLTHGAPLHALAEEPDGSEAEDDKPQAIDGAKPGHGAKDSMAATLTDVQAAIEQLGVRSGIDGASRSFSFASTRTGGGSESEPDADDEDGPAWHRNARSALAAAAARNVDNRDSLAPPPPIPFELSDESEPEDEDHTRGNDLLARAQSPPPSANTITFRAKSPQYVIPSPSSPGRTASPPPTATATSFRTQTSPLRSQTPRATSPPTSARPPTPRKPDAADSPDQSPVIPPSDDVHPPAFELPASRSQVLAQAAAAPLPASPAPASPSVASFGPAQSLAAALRSTSPGIRSASPAIRSGSPAIRSASPASHPQPAPSTASLPTPVTPTLSRSPAPSVLSFNSNRYIDRRSSSPYPPPTAELPAPPVNKSAKEARSPSPKTFNSAMFSSPAPAQKEVSSPAPPHAKDFASTQTHRDAITSPHTAPRKYTNTGASVMGLPSPATSASGIAAAQSQSLSPTSARFRQASVNSEAPSVYPPQGDDYAALPTNQWALAHVLAWLTAKGFDQDVRKAFTENDITGDVLLELDGSTLKDELGITAFGKRTRLVKAITGLKTGEKEKGSGTDTDVPKFGGRAARSSAGWSSSRPGTPAGAAKEQEDESRLRVRNGNGTRPTSLILSPSDGALATRQLWNTNRDQNSGNSERGVLSEGEAPRKPDIAKSKQFFDNQTPTTTKTDPSEAGSTPISSFPPSPSFKREKDKLATPKKEKDDGSVISGHSRGKKSVDGTSTGGKDRLSIFGTALGKGRKPAPRYSTSGDAPAVAPEERSHRSLSRLYMGSGSQRKAKDRPSMPPVSPVTQMDAEARKRTISGPVGGMKANGGLSPVIPQRNLSPQMPQRTLSTAGRSPSTQTVPGLKPGERAVDQIGEPDYNGWMRKKGDRYNSWKLRYFVLKGPHLYYLRSRTETKIKGYINITGYKVIADETVNPGHYGFRIVHDTLKPHFFSSEEQATIIRNFSDPVRSSCNIPTIPLVVAQQMNPAPRPPSPSEREAAQRAARRENPNQLSSRDARILMGLPESGPPPHEPSEQHRMNSFFAENGQQPTFDSRQSTAGSGYNESRPSGFNDRQSGFNDRQNGFGDRQSGFNDRQSGFNDGRQSVYNDSGSGYNRGNPAGYNKGYNDRMSMAETERSSVAPTRPSREMRPGMSKTVSRSSALSNEEQALLEWVNSRLPPTCPLAEDLSSSMASGLILFRLAEAIKESDSGVPDSAFPRGPGDDRLDGLFKLFDFLLDNDVRMGAVSINDVRNGNGEKIAQLVRSLKVWDEKRRAGPRQKQTVATGPWMGITSY